VRNPRERLRDILDAIGHIERYTLVHDYFGMIRKSFGMSSSAISRISSETWKRYSRRWADREHAGRTLSL